MSSKYSQGIVKEIKQLTCASIDGSTLLPFLLTELSKIIPSTTHTFARIDASFNIVNIYDDSPNIMEYGPLYAKEFMMKKDCLAYPYWGEWLRCNNNVVKTDEYAYRNFYRSEMYNEILKPMHQHHSLLACIKTPSKPTGMLLLTREKSDLWFTERERKLMNDLRPFIAYGLSHQSGGGDLFSDSGASGTLIFNRYAKLLNGDENALYLLYRAYQNENIQIVNAKSRIIPAEVIKIIKDFAMMHETKDDWFTRPPQTIRKGGYGSFEINVRWHDPFQCGGDELITVTVEHRVPLKIGMLRRCNTLGLTNKQTEVALLIAEGLTYEEIARRKQVSKYTVMDHMKAIFDKLKIKNRSELILKIMVNRVM